MRLTIEGPPKEGEPRRPLRSRLLWFIALWIGGLVATAAAAYLLRAALFI
jgi:hypothetical protein